MKLKNILRKYVKEYIKEIIFFYITCKWKLHFSNCHTSFISANTEYKRIYLLGSEPCDMLETYLFSEIEYLYFTDRSELSYISEMTITFITEFRFMAYNHYMDLPKQMVERNLLRKKRKP